MEVWIQDAELLFDKKYDAWEIFENDWKYVNITHFYDVQICPIIDIGT